MLQGGRTVKTAVDPLRTMDGSRPIVVTGASGFIGTHVVRALVTRLPRATVAAVDVTPSSGTEAGGRLVRLVGDVSHRSIRHAIQALRPGLIVHLAAITDSLSHDSDRMIRRNVGDFEVLLDTAHGVGARVVYASSAAVYGNGSVPMIESQQLRPLNAYALSKMLMEESASRYASRGVSTLGLRFFNVFGVGESHKGRAASMVSQIAGSLLRAAPVRLFSPGNQMRDFVYIPDVVDAVWRACMTQASGVANVGSGRATTFNDVVTLLAHATHRDPDIEYVDPPRGPYQARTQADLTHARSLLGYQPRWPLPAAVRMYVREMTSGAARSGL